MGGEGELSVLLEANLSKEECPGNASEFFLKEDHVASASLPRRDGLSVIRSGLGPFPAVAGIDTYEIGGFVAFS